MSKATISKRAQILLIQLVELYLRDGVPVGSKTLANETVNSLSSATVRKVLSDLEEQGYLISPHTSSGRIPTALGLRFFVDSLNTFHTFETRDLQDYQKKFDSNKLTDDLLNTASRVLSELTHMVGIVTLPKREQVILRHVEFVRLSAYQVLVILVLNEREVQNRIIVTDNPYSVYELIQVGNFLNDHFVGRDLMKARAELFETLLEDQLHTDRLVQAVLEVTQKAFLPAAPDADYILAGQQNLLADSKNINMSQLKKLFQAFTEKRQILQILDKCLQTDGVQMYIGEESGYDVLFDYAMVASRYCVDGRLVGVLGVIGPTRMPYAKIIPIVDLTARMLSTTLENENQSPY